MKFGYTILYVNDIEKTMMFYEKAFGLKQKFIHESGYGELETGDNKLAFAKIELAKSNGVEIQSLPLEGAAPAFEIAFVTNDVVSAFNKAINEGAIEVKKPTQKPWGQLVGYVRDLNGFIVEICTPVN